MKRLHVVLMTGSLAIGGTERNILNLARSLDPWHFSVEVLCNYRGQPLEEELRREGIPVVALKAPSTGLPWHVRLLRHNLPYQWRLWRFLRSRRRAVVHAFGFPMAYYVVLLGRLAGVRRLIFSVQDWDVWKKSRLYRCLDTVCSRLAAKVIADGEGARRLAVRSQGMVASRTVVIYDGVKTSELRPTRARADILRELGIDPGRCVVGVIARLDVRKKGQDHFIRALPEISRRAPQTAFLIVGGGPDEAALQRLAGSLPEGSRPVFAGFRRDLADMLNAIDILVIPSLWESVPKILLEGMWMRKAIVATTAGDIREILDSRTGVLIPPADHRAIADAVAPLALSGSERREMGERAHMKISREGLTADKTVRRYETLYSAL